MVMPLSGASPFSTRVNSKDAYTVRQTDRLTGLSLRLIFLFPQLGVPFPSSRNHHLLEVILTLCPQTHMNGNLSSGLSAGVWGSRMGLLYCGPGAKGLAAFACIRHTQENQNPNSFFRAELGSNPRPCLQRARERHRRDADGQETLEKAELHCL